MSFARARNSLPACSPSPAQAALPPCADTFGFRCQYRGASIHSDIGLISRAWRCAVSRKVLPHRTLKTPETAIQFGPPTNSMNCQRWERDAIQGVSSIADAVVWTMTIGVVRSAVAGGDGRLSSTTPSLESGSPELRGRDCRLW
jgi:hypothetical protein